MAETLCFSVGESDSKPRLDVFLAAQLQDVTRAAIQAWIRAGHVLVGGRPRKPSYRVRDGDCIRVTPPPPQPSDLTPEPLPLCIVYEDEALVVVDKPAGLVVHPGAGHRRGTLANALLYHFQQISRRDTVRPGIVHRLDKATSGLLVVAKNERVHEALSRQFKLREVEKHYLALVYGHLEQPRGVIDLPLGRDPRVRTRISTRSRRPRQALTEYQVVRFLPDFTYVRVILHTGRTHQIRVHLQQIRHPVVGDETYGVRPQQVLRDADRIRIIQRLGRHFLHAARLAFWHPGTGQRMSFESALPRELADALSSLE